MAPLTYYDALGRVAEKSRPVEAGQEATARFVRYEYDLLGRVTVQIEPDSVNPEGNRTSFAYNGRSSTVTDAKGQTRTTVKNSQGQVISVTDAAGGVLTHAYDPFGNLDTTTDPAGNVTDLGYDLRGRKITLSDPDMGNWTYEYNALGELLRQTDALGRVTTLSYDKLGRMTKRTEADLVSNWYYDKYKAGTACAAGIGKLCEAETGVDYRRKHTYDPFGRPANTSTTIDNPGSPYVATTTYDAHGRVATRTWPTGFSVKYVYTARGFLREVRKNDAGNALYWRANALDAEGHLTQQTYGNNVVTTFNYNLATGRLDSIVAGAGNSVQNLGYGYDILGNLETRVDGVTGVSESFDYDALNRLTQATAQGGGIAGTRVTAYAYDAIGNLTCQGEIGACSAASPNLLYGATVTVGTLTRTLPHAVRALTGTVNGVGNPTYRYDANGNLEEGAGRTVHYQSFNLPDEIVANGKKLQYVHDAEHQRILERVCGAGSNCDPPERATVYLHPANGAGLFYEKETVGATVTHKHFISAGGATVAVVTQTGTTLTTTYWHKDHLGSTVVVTNGAGAVLERLAYEPFGKRRNPNGLRDSANTLVGQTTERGFTGHEHLDEVGLVHMNGRIFDPALGRFMTADSTVDNPLNLQSYNRYSYVNNNPLAFTDPSGHFLQFIAAAIIGELIAETVTVFVLETLLYSSAMAAVTEATIAAIATISGAAAGGFSAGLIASGGDLQGGLQGAFTGGLFGIAGTVGAATSLERYAAHAFAGCVSGAVGGGSCGRGAASAVVGKYVTNETTHWSTEARFVAATVAGGTASVVGGGKFANGAVTAGFGYLFNECSNGRCIMNGKTHESTYDAETGRSIIYHEEKIYRPTTAAPRIEYGGTIEWVDLEVDQIVEIFVKRNIPPLSVGFGIEPGVRYYQFEIGSQLYESTFGGNSPVAIRSIASEWGQGFVWKPSPLDTTEFGRLRFRMCAVGACSAN